MQYYTCSFIIRWNPIILTVQQPHDQWLPACAHDQWPSLSPLALAMGGSTALPTYIYIYRLRMNMSIWDDYRDHNLTCLLVQKIGTVSAETGHVPSCSQHDVAYHMTLHVDSEAVTTKVRVNLGHGGRVGPGGGGAGTVSMLQCCQDVNH